MSSEALQYITEMQMRYLEPKALNILARKLNALQNHDEALDSATIVPTYSLSIFTLYLLWQLIIDLIM